MSQDLDSMKVRELYAIAKEKKIACYKTLSKVELVDAINNHKEDTITYLKTIPFVKLRVVARTCEIHRFSSFKKQGLIDQLELLFKEKKYTLKDVKVLVAGKK